MFYTRMHSAGKKDDEIRDCAIIIWRGGVLKLAK